MMKLRTKMFCMVWCILLMGLVSSMIGCTCPGPPIGTTPSDLVSDQPADQLLFDDVEAGKPQKKSFLLFADGQEAITVTKMEIVDNEGGTFSLVNPPAMPLELAPGKEGGARITVEFLPKEAKVYTARIRLTSPNAYNVDDTGHVHIRLRHILLSPDPVFDCSSLTFGPVEKGKEKVLSCTLRNRGNTELVVSDAKYEKTKGGQKVDFEWVAPGFPLTVPVGKNVEVKVKYAPSDYPPREDQGAFVLDSNLTTKSALDKPRLRVVGITALPLVQIVPLYPACQGDTDCSRIDRRLRCTQDDVSKQKLCLQGEKVTPFLIFPLTSTGRTTKRTFAIRNIGDRPLQIESLGLDAGTSMDYRVLTQGLMLPLSIDPGQEKQVSVEYSPSDNQPDTGKVIVSSNAGNNPKAQVLLEAASRGCNLDVLPRKMDFLQPNSSQQLTLVNRGNESCVVKSVTLKSGKSEPFALLPVPKKDQTLVPSGSLTILVKYNPTTPTSAKDFVVIESTDPDEPKIEVELNSKPVTGSPCELSATPSTLSFNVVPVGRSRKMSVTITNLGYADCEISALNVLGTIPSPNSAFQLASTVRTPLKINAGGNIRLDVNFTPPSEQGYEGALEIQSNDPQQPNFRIKLSGTSGTLCLEVVPPTMDFGSTKFGCATPNRAIEIFNLGAAKCKKTINVSKISLQNNTDKEFRLNAARATPFALNPGDSLRIELSYKAKNLGVDTGALNVENDVQGQSPVTIPLIGEGVATNDQKDVFKQLSQPLSDILFVIDDSGSMGPHQQNLANNMSTFINWAVRLNVDYQLMVTTTDITKTGANAPGCARGNPKIVTPQTIDPAGSFANNVKVGTVGSASEKALEAGYRALIPPASTGCNKGFHRKDASLSIVFLTDEPEQSPQTVNFYVSFFKSLKGPRNLDKITVSTVSGPPPNGCRAGGLSASSSPRLWEVATKLKGIKEPLCSKNWAQILSNLVVAIFGYRSQYFLSRQADPNTIRVKVNGSVVPTHPTNGWTYDATTNSINFTKSQIPPPSATVQVEYKALCLP